MTNRKNYNSILFLTVYLGLVLVGATPQVMTYAATNSLFDLRNEIEFKDDLDNQPDDCEKLKEETDEQNNIFFAQYYKSVVSFLKTPSIKGRQILPRFKGDEEVTDWFPTFDQDLYINLTDYKLDKNSLFIKFKIKPVFSQVILPVALSYNSSLDFQHCKSQSLSERIIYENTKVTYQKGQIFIVTRLPRGSIDSLLK